MLDENFSHIKEYLAVGLVGSGSECFGFDDEFSLDHDFGPGFCMWLTDQVYDEIGEELQRAYEELPLKLPLVLLLPAWVGAAISILKINKINQQYGIKDSIFSSYNSEQHLERLQRNQQSFASFKGCLADLFKNHIFLAIPIACFFGTVLAEMMFLFNIDNHNGRIKEMPTTFKELVCLLFKNHPIYCISLVLVILASPFILYNLLSGIFENSSSLDAGFIMLFPAMIITNFISGFLGFPFVFANAILATFRSMLKK